MSQDVQFKQQLEAMAKQAEGVDVDAEHDPETSRRSSNAGLKREAAVQRKARGEAGGDVQNVAARGVQGSGGQLPHMEQIQRSFGAHDVSGIQAHTGGQAAEASREMGAEAYATGSSVAFGGQPDLHTAAHEAAHVVQQRQGVQLKANVGDKGDAYEKTADEVADRVVAGKPAGDLLGEPKASAAPASAGPVQMEGKKKPAETKEETQQHTHTAAAHETYGALRASMMLASTQMHAAAKEIDATRKKNFGDAGVGPAFGILQGHFNHVQSVARHVSSLVKQMDPMITDQVEFQHMAPEFHAVWGGYKAFKTAMDDANTFATAHDNPLKANPEWVKQELEDLDGRFGGHYKDAFAQSTKSDGAGGDQQADTWTALDEHLDAALASATAVRAGTDMDIDRLRTHVTEAALLAKQIPADNKALAKHQAKFSALVHEFKVLEKEKQMFVPNLKDLQPAMDEFAKLAK